jgi:hypothetical protein
MKLKVRFKGGTGSGHHGHAGRPGLVGGSQPGEGIDPYPGAAPDRLIQNPWDEDRKALEFLDDELFQMQVDYEDSTGFYEDDDPTYSGNYPEDQRHVSHNDATPIHKKQIKHGIVAELADRTDLPYDTVNDLVANWAKTSNGSDLRALLLQQDFAEELGLELSDWQVEEIAKLVKEAEFSSPAVRNITEKWHRLYPEETQRKFARAMYDLTQEELVGNYNIDTIKLFRGFDTGADEPKSQFVPPEDSIIGYFGNALESWTADYDTAKGFGNTIITMNVPVENIIGTCRTGFGCLTEGEFVIAANVRATDPPHNLGQTAWAITSSSYDVDLLHTGQYDESGNPIIQ